MSDNGSEDTAYKVGYRRPPLEHRFVKGRSGNPKGRPKGAKSIDQLLTEAMARKVSMVDGGKRRQVTLAEALVMKLVSGALSGTTKERLLVLQQLRECGVVEFARSAETKQLAITFVQRLKNEHP